MKKIFYPISFIILLATATLANAYYPQQRAADNDPVKNIQTTLKKLEEFSNNTTTASPVLLRTFIETEIIPHFSFDDMSRWITGPFAQRMTAEEKIDFHERLKEAFLNSLAKHLGSFNALEDRVRFYPTRFRSNNEAMVSAKVYRENNYPVKLDFRMRQFGKDWKIIDVRANGTSAIVYYRKVFLADLRQYRRR